MKKITIAFDVDGTLIETWHTDTDTLTMHTINDWIATLLCKLSSFKNTKIIVWSWQWKQWASDVCYWLWIEWAVDSFESKNYMWKDKDWKHIFKPDIKPDISIDDCHSCDLWIMNLIVHEKWEWHNKK